MVGKAIWKGYIRFSDITVPVKLHTAVHQDRIRFHLLHKRDRTRLRQQMICAYEKVPVPSEEQIRGFELEDGKYILVDPKELEQTEPGDSRKIEVREFVKTSQSNHIFIEHAYYLEPDTAAPGYSEFAGALKETGTAGICSWTMRKRSYLGALEIKSRVLCLNTMRYAEEVIPARSLGLEETPLSKKELEIAENLINQLSAPFRPEKYENEHQKKLQELIDKKVRGEKVSMLRPRRLKPTPSDNLLDVLEESLKKIA